MLLCCWFVYVNVLAIVLYSKYYNIIINITSNQLDWFNNLKLNHNYLNKNLSSIFNDTQQTNSECRAANTNIIDNPVLCNDDIYYLPLFRNTTRQHLPLINIARVWNEFPVPEIKQIVRKTSFEFSLKKHFLDRWSSSLYCNRDNCPSKVASISHIYCNSFHYIRHQLFFPPWCVVSVYLCCVPATPF